MNEDSIEDVSMDIYCDKGTKVKFLNCGGYDEDLQEAQLLLSKEEVYTVKCIDIGSWVSYVVLEEFPDKFFNTVMFSEVK